jgi:RsiW-degrading membrane proteinase PrsW (M82 family)
MNPSSIQPKKPEDPQSFSVLFLILGICFVVVSIGIPYMYHESNMTCPPYLWVYVLIFIIGVVLIGVNATKIDQQNKRENKQ